MGVDRIAARLRVVFFGTYDTHRPRFRILKRGLELAGAEVLQCHRSVWGNLEDRSHLRSVRDYLGPTLRWCRAAPGLARAYRALPPHDVVVVPYLGQADVGLARRLTRKRRLPLVFDPYVSLQETVIDDRQLLRGHSVAARAVRMLDARSFCAADALLVDTGSHGELMASYIGKPIPPWCVVPVGAEGDVFVRAPLPPPAATATVLFYGSMIPLHGIETIIRAAAALRAHSHIRFRIIGTGQEYPRARALAAREGADRVIEWEERVPYERLPEEIARATVCLGIFGTSRKARAVVPNKVYQAVAVGRPVITGDTPAMREWFTDGADCLLVPPGDHASLAEAVARVVNDHALQETLADGGHRLFQRAFTPGAIGATARAAIEEIGSSAWAVRRGTMPSR